MKLLAFAFGIVKVNQAMHRHDEPRCWCRRPEICPWEEIKRNNGGVLPPG